MSFPIHVKDPGNQKKDLAAGIETVSTTSLEELFKGKTGIYYLILKIDNLTDLEGVSWTTDAVDRVVFGPYTIDNTVPEFNDSRVVSTVDAYHALKPKLVLNVSDYLAEENQLRMCITYDDATPCPTDLKSIKKTGTGSRYIQYEPNKNKILDEIQNTFEVSNHVHSIHITVADAAGNYIQKIFPYEVAYTITYDKNTGTGTMGKSYCDKNVDCALKNNSFSKTG